jgi:predicted O-methyltransferase YrrM
VNSVIENIYRTGTVTGKSGRVFKLHSEVSRSEGEMLHRIVANDPGVCRTLEVGAAFGLSALYICDALKDRPGAYHVMIDPLQRQLWDDAAVGNLERSGCTYFKLYEQGSEIAMPNLLQSGEQPFDLVFVDGSHFFDQTMIDCFYATKLLRPGGYLAIDDIQLPPVRAVLDYLWKFPCYETYAFIEEEKDGRPLLRAAARAALAPFPREKLNSLLSRRVLRRVLERKQISMIVLRKKSEDERWKNWEQWFHID